MMIMSRVCLTAALALLPVIARAQTTPSTTGWLDFGGRGTTIDGDGARYERYRDLSDGVFLEALRLTAERQGWFLDATADHVGRRDQRFTGTFVKPGKLSAWAMWDQIPMTMSRTTRTLFVEDLEEPQGVLTIDNAIQAQAQASPAALSVLFAQISRPFETESQRNIAQAGVEYLATSELTLRSNVQYTTREGSMPYGGSFGHSSLVEFPAPIQHTLTDFDGGAEFARDRLLLRAGYAGSWFQNAFTTATFDNPFRATDSTSVPSQGRLSLAPNSSFISVNGLASVKLPRRSRVTAYLSAGSLEDTGDTLMAQTINTTNATAPLERTRLEGKARTTAVNLNVVSRPARYLDVDVRYRSYDYDNRTPVFTMTQRVAYDNAPSDLAAAPVDTEPFSILRRSFDADLRLTPVTRAAVGVGFTRLGEERTHRIFESTRDNVMRVTFDSVGHRWFSLRTKYEHAERRGEGLDTAVLISVNEQPGLRHFDVAPRDRDRITMLGSVTPSGNLVVTASLAAGQDDYQESLFGLRDNTHRVYSLGVDATPAGPFDLVFGGSYSFERYNALARSRQANTAAEFADPSRNWASDGTDRVHSVILSAGLSKIARKVDATVSYDFSRARTTYDYITGPVPNRTLPEEVTVDTTLPTPTALPLVRSDLQRATTDVIYALTPRVGVGLSYWHERYRVSDFTLDAEATPNLARGQSLLMGYLYKPYTANTIWARMVVRW